MISLTAAGYQVTRQEDDTAALHRTNSEGEVPGDCKLRV